MAKVAITEQYLEDIADAIRVKTGLTDVYYPAEMAEAILSISGSGGIIPTGTINITTNGIHNVTNYASADVNVSSTINNQNKTVTPTENVQQITADSSYTGLGTVTVDAIDSNYIGSNIDRNTSSDLSVSGATVTVPSGFYEDEASASVATTTHPKPTASINSTTGLVTASHTQTTGYVTGSTTTGTLQLTTQAAKTVTPSTSSQTAVAAGRYTTGAVSVAAVPTEEKTATTNGEVTPSSGKFLSKVTVNVPTGSTINNQNKSVSPTESSQEVTADSGYTGLGTVTVGAISSTYIGSDIAQRSSTNLSVSGATVTAPAGYYAESASKSVASGTAGTPSATKGSVSNHSVSVTPSVTNTTGFITGGTKTGTAVMISASELVSGSETKTANGTYDVTNLAELVVNVPSSSPTIQSLSITPSTSEQTFNASSVDGYKPVTVAAMPTMTLPTSATTSPTSGYTSKATIGRSTNDQIINIPPGYNSAGAYYRVSAVANGSATAPASISGTSASISTGTNTLTLTKTVSVTPSVTAGYISSGTAGNSSVSLTASVSVNPTPTVSGATVTIPSGYYSSQTSKSVSSGSASAPTSISGSTATVSTGTNTLTLTKTVSVTPVVSAGYVSSGTATNSSVSLTAAVTTKAATTYNTSTTDQTISSGTYLTGTQTIKAVTVSGLSADKILSGTTVMVGDSNDADRIASVSGSVVIQKYYTGSSAPSSSLGSDGDIYLQE